MIVYYVGLPLLLLAAVFDATLMTLFRLWGGAPNLVLMIVISWALVTELEEALPWAVIGGIMRDLLSAAPTGSSALALVLIVVVVDTYLPKASWRNVPLPLLVIGIATVAYDMMLFAILVVAGRPVPNLWTLGYVILPGVVANLAMVLFVFRTIGGINQFLRPTRTSLLS